MSNANKKSDIHRLHDTLTLPFTELSNSSTWKLARSFFRQLHAIQE